MFRWLTSLFSRKSGPPAERPSVATGFLDAHRQRREPSPRELVNELKGLAWTCASINAACASHAPRLYVKKQPGQAEPECAHRPLERRENKSPVSQKALPTNVAAAEVTDQPLLELFRTVNPRRTPPTCGS